LPRCGKIKIPAGDTGRVALLARIENDDRKGPCFGHVLFARIARLDDDAQPIVPAGCRNGAPVKPD
jgi:hypothetical protein